jgi:putative DNA primase/helicase
MSIASLRKRILDEGGWLQVFAAVAPELEDAIAAHRRRSTSHVPCPVHGSRRGDRGDGFRLFDDANQTGGVVCNSCGHQSDGFSTLSWLWRVPVTEVLRRLGRALDLEMERNVPRARKGASRRPMSRSADDLTAYSASAETQRRTMRRLYEDSLPLGHRDASLGRLYLESRGLCERAFRACPDLTFHPSLLLFDDQGQWRRHPGILAAFRDPGGEIVTLQRTYLRPDDGCRNRDLPRLAMRVPPGSAMPGGAIRIGGPHLGRIGIAEGWETACAAAQISGLPCWAATGWALLEAWEPPGDVRHVVVWADNDASGRGQRSADTLASRLIGNGLDATVMVPPQPDTDWADVLLDLRSFPALAGLRCMPPVLHGTW